MVSAAIDRLTVSGQDQLGISPGVAERAAASQCALLLCGPTGTGKGHLARWIHQHSSRANAPFVPVNCGALPESLIDSHLFGHARGSFSGATHDHVGLVRSAHGGTLLLDEVSELPVTAQVRLLRLLEEREVQPVGYSKPVNVDVRIIAATNADLSAGVQAGRFREDLYFRLDVLRLHLKPLCDRRADIPSLIDRFNREFALFYGQAELQFGSEAIDCMVRQNWPGNIRQLRSVVERLHVLCGGAANIDRQALTDYGQVSETSGAQSAGAALAAAKFDMVNQILASCRGNMSRAAATLGVHRSTLYRWLATQPVPA